MTGSRIAIGALCILCSYVHSLALRINSLSQDGAGDRVAPVVGFVKTHKTGSTTVLKLMQLFAQHHNMSIMFPADSHFFGYPSEFPGAANEALLPHAYNLIANHGVFNSEKWRYYLKAQPFFTSVLRDPSRQAVSAFNYHRFHGVHGLASSWPQHIAWMKALQSKSQVSIDVATACFLNPQAWDLGWYTYTNYTTAYDRDEAMISKWLAALESDFTKGMVISEYFDESLVLLATALRAKPEEFSWVLQNSWEYQDPPSEQEYAELGNLYPVDRALYNHFNNTFWRLWRGVSEAGRASALAQLRNRSEVLKALCPPSLPPSCPREWRLGEVSYTHYLNHSSDMETIDREISMLQTSAVGLPSTETMMEMESESYAERQRIQMLSRTPKNSPMER